MNEESLEQLQTKIAFLERANSELSDVLFRQQREIDALGARMQAIAERLESHRADDRVIRAEEERPPHY